jgi:peptidyl-prolyl cis-trans isomerase C
VREELINRKVIAQEAQRRRAEQRRGQGAARHRAPGDHGRAFLRDYARKHPITRPRSRRIRPRQAQHGDKEYKARHILVETEDQAKSLIAELKKGAKFDELASKNSKDTGSAQRGGDLDWNVPAPSTSVLRAMVKLEKGKYSERR